MGESQFSWLFYSLKVKSGNLADYPLPLFHDSIRHTLSAPRRHICNVGIDFQETGGKAVDNALATELFCKPPRLCTADNGAIRVWQEDMFIG